MATDQDKLVPRTGVSGQWERSYAPNLIHAEVVDQRQRHGHVLQQQACAAQKRYSARVDVGQGSSLQPELLERCWDEVVHPGKVSVRGVVVVEVEVEVVVASVVAVVW
jgi:hypothetical protein